MVENEHGEQDGSIESLMSYFRRKGTRPYAGLEGILPYEDYSEVGPETADVNEDRFSGKETPKSK